MAHGDGRYRRWCPIPGYPEAEFRRDRAPCQGCADQRHQLLPRPEAFELLAEQIVPDLVRSHEAARPLRIWIAGCSTGEETYSIAMLFVEEIAATKPAVALQVFASDVDGDALAFARDGLYPEIDRGGRLPGAAGPLFYEAKSAVVESCPKLRDLVVFAIQDVLADPPFSRLDLVSCRNLLIYLRPEAQEKVLALFDFALREGGILFLGGAGDGSQFRRPVRGDLQEAQDLSALSAATGRRGPISPSVPERARALAQRAQGATRPYAARADAAGAGRRLCPGFCADQPQRRVPLLFGRDGPLSAGGGGGAQSRPACNGARRAAQ